MSGSGCGLFLSYYSGIYLEVLRKNTKPLRIATNRINI